MGYSRVLKNWPCLAAVGLAVALFGRPMIVSYLIIDARRALESHHYEVSEYRLKIAGILDGRNGQIALLRARSFRHLENYNQATWQLSRARQLGIGSAIVQVENILAQAQQGRLSDPGRELNSLLTDPFVDSVEVCHAFACGARRTDDSDLLLWLLDHWWEVSPNDPFQFQIRGEMWKDRKNWTSAEEAYRHVLRLDPNNTNARLGLGSSLFQQARSEEALECFELILDAEPNNSTALAERTKCLSELVRTRTHD